MSDLPPSYNEVVNNPRLQSHQPSTTPSAPRLEAIVTSPDLVHTQGQQPPQQGTVYPYVHNEGRFSAWNDTATEILITNRLEMNERFERGQNQQERDELWDIILNQLLAAGFSFTRIDLIQYWEYQFYIYKSIVNSLSAGTQSVPNWKYFETMDAVFKYSNEASNLNTLGQDYTAVDSSPATNTFGGLTNLGSIRDALPSEAISSAYNGIQSNPVITSQPIPGLKIPTENPDTYVPLALNREPEGDGDCCCCCIGCCDDSPGGYSGRTGGYTSHNDNYNTFGSDGYNGGFTSDYYCQTSHSNDDNRDDGCDTGAGGGDDGCCDSDGGRDDGCCDSGGGGDDGCYDSGGGGDDGCCDTGGGDDGCCDSGGGGCDD